MSSNPVQVLIAAYHSEDGAEAALKDFRAMHREGSIDLIDAAVAVHTGDGKVKIEETADPSGKTWGKRGAIAGGIAGRASRRASSPGRSSAGRAAASGAGSATRASRTRTSRQSVRACRREARRSSPSPKTTSSNGCSWGLEGYERIARHALSADAAAVIVAEGDAAADEKPTSTETDPAGS